MSFTPGARAYGDLEGGFLVGVIDKWGNNIEVGSGIWCTYTRGLKSTARSAPALVLSIYRPDDVPDDDYSQVYLDVLYYADAKMMDDYDIA